MNKALFQQLEQSLREAIEIKKGQLKPSRVTRVETPDDITLLRKKLKLSQAQFASVLGISTDTLQNWEQGRRHPTGPARVLLRVAARHPEVLLEVA